MQDVRHDSESEISACRVPAHYDIVGCSVEGVEGVAECFDGLLELPRVMRLRGEGVGHEEDAYVFPRGVGAVDYAGGEDEVAGVDGEGEASA